MKTKRLTKATFNKFYTLQEKADKMRKEINESDQLTINGYFVDKERVATALDCISAAIEELYEIVNI